LTIPSEYSLIDEISEGTYTLNNYEENSDNVAFDIADWNRVIIGARVEDHDFTGYKHLERTDYDDIEVVVSKNGTVCSIEYTMIYDNDTTIKGSYVGELEVVDKWM